MFMLAASTSGASAGPLILMGVRTRTSRLSSMVTSGLPPSSGQPSSSVTPFQISAVSGHLSTSFSNVSPSRSVLGQPLRVGSVEGSPATFGACVVAVGDAVVVVVRIGAAVVVLEAVLVLGLRRTLVERVGDAVAVAVGGGATVGPRILRWRRPSPWGRRRPCPRRRRRRASASGQPFFFGSDEGSPFTSRQASSLSMTPSSSLSISGQPSESSKPSRSSGISGQPSMSSRTPS